MKFSIGIKSGGMDGPALLGIPTLCLDANPNNRRMRSWNKNIKNYKLSKMPWYNSDDLESRLQSKESDVIEEIKNMIDLQDYDFSRDSRDVSD